MYHKHIRAGNFSPDDFGFVVTGSKGDLDVNSNLIYADEYFTFHELKREIRYICKKKGWVCKVEQVGALPEVYLSFGLNDRGVYLQVRLELDYPHFPMRSIVDELNSSM